MRDLKLTILIVAFSILPVIALALIFGNRTNNGEEIDTKQPIEGIEIEPAFYNLGEVPINSGMVTREYQLKNVSQNTLKLKRIATSCMCTRASFEIGTKKTKFFGMEGRGDRNPPINIEIPAGATAKVVVQFDPAAHGPQGIGSFERSVYLTFSDPAGTKELKFSGTVVN
jgi:hypothetical protein